MKYYGKISDPKDLITLEVLSNAVRPATAQQIEDRTVSNPIAPVNLDQAVKSSLASTNETLSATQKKHAQEFLGTMPLSFKLADDTVVVYNFVCNPATTSND